MIRTSFYELKNVLNSDNESIKKFFNIKKYTNKKNNELLSFIKIIEKIPNSWKFNFYIFSEFFGYEYDIIFLLKDKKSSVNLYIFECKNKIDANNLNKNEKKIKEKMENLCKYAPDEININYVLIDSFSFVKIFYKTCSLNKIKIEQVSINDLNDEFLDSKEIIDGKHYLNEKCLNNFKKVENLIINNKNISIKEFSELFKDFKEILDHYDVIYYNLEAGVGKTHSIILLFYELLKNEEKDLLFLNHRFKCSYNQIFKYFFSNVFYHINSVIEKSYHKKIDILIVDEAQRLTIDQLHEIRKTYNKIILLGDSKQIFDNKEMDNDLLKNHNDIKFKEITFKKIKFLRFSKNFLNCVKCFLDNDKYKELMKKADFKNEKIYIYSNINKFLNKFDSIRDTSKRIFTEIKKQSHIYKEYKILSDYGFQILDGKSSNDYPFNDNFIKHIGTVYNIFSFELNYNFVIISSSLNEVKRDKYIFGELYTILTRTKKELHILFLKNINDYLEWSKFIKRGGNIDE